ncbi:hypothetical protein CRE_23343 [Caenorhabditis remanei]|uniref:F-box domain-containing protein n=1 Tax=Caenorhabditis remanei TaxID=31234 RepID=E3MGZ0_CAERE|nr:hypothetical protein CRE_23343 [Caenorhabditis remanei]
MPSQTLLVDFPAVVKSKVLEKLDLVSVLKLRKVCYNLRQFIDENPPKVNSCDVEICTTYGDCMSIIMESLDSLNFSPYENGCILEWRTFTGVRKKVVEMGNYIDKFLKEFKIIMKHHWRPVLDSFAIVLSQEGNSEQILEELTRIGCVSTDEVVFDGCAFDQIAEFLPFFNSDDLNKIRIEFPYEQKEEDQEDDIKMLNLEEIRQLDQWKNSKHVKVEAGDSRVRIQDFLHFEEVEIHCKIISIQDLVLLKQSFLTSSTLTSFDILIVDVFNEEEEFCVNFGHPSLFVDNANLKEKWFFRIPNDEDVLSVTCNIRDRFIFRKIKIQDVPNCAVIKN